MSAVLECPFANINEPIVVNNPGKCPFHAHITPIQNLNKSVQLNIKWGEHQTSADQAALLADIGGGDRIRELTTRFYARAFEDNHIKEFFFLDDGATAHGKRLADWIIQKMGGEGEPWTDSGRWGMRQPTHHAAWHSAKRPSHRQGQRFKLDDCRIWMRLHFWAARECGLADHTPFWEWYVQFIEHFIAFYERAAPPYAHEDAEWSAYQANIDLYTEQGNLMLDVIGKTSVLRTLMSRRS